MADQGQSIFSQYTFGTANRYWPAIFGSPCFPIAAALSAVRFYPGKHNCWGDTSGFAVSGGTTAQQLTELFVAMMLGLAAFLGVLWSAWFLPLSYLTHAVWDLAHHNRFRLRLVAIPQWYVPGAQQSI